MDKCINCELPTLEGKPVCLSCAEDEERMGWGKEDERRIFDDIGAEYMEKSKAMDKPEAGTIEEWEHRVETWDSSTFSCFYLNGKLIEVRINYCVICKGRCCDYDG